MNLETNDFINQELGVSAMHLVCPWVSSICHYYNYNIDEKEKSKRAAQQCFDTLQPFHSSKNTIPLKLPIEYLTLAEQQPLKKSNNINI